MERFEVYGSCGRPNLLNAVQLVRVASAVMPVGEPGGACAYFRTGSFATGARLVQAVAELPGLGDHPPDVDLRPDGVFVRLFTTAPAPDGLSSRDVELARRTDGRGYP